MNTDAPTELTDAEIKAQEAIRTDNIQVNPDSEAGEFTMRILAEDTLTIDGRKFVPGAVTWRNPPISLLFLNANLGDGHKGSKVGGVIHKIWRDGNEVWGSGSFSSDEDGQSLRSLISEGAISGVSADVGGAQFEFVAEEGSDRKIQEIHQGTIMGVTVLPMQAFDEGKIVVTASGFPVDPPAEWFTNPNLNKPTAMTVEDSGRVFGHLAQWGTCHMGVQRTCLTAPRSPSNYAHFAHGEVVCHDGSRVRTGKITLGTGHAPLGLAAGAAAEHYDDTGSAVADIVVGEDTHGIWFSGAVRPDITPERIRAFRASAVSGDWRTIGGGLDMVALLAVNTPGFPVPRASILASAEESDDTPSALVSAGFIPSEDTDATDGSGEVELSGDCGCGGPCCDEKKAKKKGKVELTTEIQDDCGCRKPKPPSRDAAFSSELLLLDLSIMESTNGLS